MTANTDPEKETTPETADEGGTNKAGEGVVEAGATTDADADAGVKPAGTAPSSGSGTATGTRRFEAFSRLYLPSIPEEARREVYFEVVKQINEGKIEGVILRDSPITLAMPGTRRERVILPLDEVLLKGSPELRTKLDAAANVVASRQVVRTRGRGLTVAELEEMGDNLDFDALLAEDKRVRLKNAKAAAKARAKAAAATKAKGNVKHRA